MNEIGFPNCFVILHNTVQQYNLVLDCFFPDKITSSLTVLQLVHAKKSINIRETLIDVFFPNLKS